jgi:glycosyltransferase involved in cell wall biosynthesis
VLSWLAKAHVYAGPAALAAGVPAVWWQHGLPSRGIDRLATWIPACRILACSNAAARAQQALGARRADLRTIYPPVDFRLVARAPTQAEARTKLGLPTAGLIVGIVARLQRWKGIDVLLDAARLWLREGADVFFVVVGGRHSLEPDYELEVKRRAHELGVGDRVRFTGHCTNVMDWLAAMDIVVNASFGEPFGMTIVEAMALGKAVVATRVGGPLEIVTDGVDGLLVPPGDAAALAAALSRLADAGLRRRLGSAARERATVYALPRFVAEVNDALREVVGR